MENGRNSSYLKRQQLLHYTVFPSEITQITNSYHELPVSNFYCLLGILLYVFFFFLEMWFRGTASVQHRRIFRRATMSVYDDVLVSQKLMSWVYYYPWEHLENALCIHRKYKLNFSYVKCIPVIHLLCTKRECK